jgi:hypothetical protein
MQAAQRGVCLSLPTACAEENGATISRSQRSRRTDAVASEADLNNQARQKHNRRARRASNHGHGAAERVVLLQGYSKRMGVVCAVRMRRARKCILPRAVVACLGGNETHVNASS